MRVWSRRPDVQHFWNRYSNGLPTLRKVCKEFPGVRHLLREKNTLQYDNLLKIYLIVLTGNQFVQSEAETVWAHALLSGRYAQIEDLVNIYAPHTGKKMEIGDAFPQEGLGLYISPDANYMNSLIIAGEIRILRWCDRRTVPTTTTHQTAVTPGYLMMRS